VIAEKLIRKCRSIETIVNFMKIPHLFDFATLDQMDVVAIITALKRLFFADIRRKNSILKLKKRKIIK
jgi:hypothetical protein